MSNEEIRTPELATAVAPVQPDETLPAQANMAGMATHPPLPIQLTIFQGAMDTSKLQAEVLALQQQVKQQSDQLRQKDDTFRSLEAEQDEHRSEIAMLARELREALQRVDYQEMVHTNLREEQESKILELYDRVGALRRGTYRVLNQIMKKDERIAELDEELTRQRESTRKMVIDLEKRVAKLEESWSVEGTFLAESEWTTQGRKDLSET
ncbi:uncharacterized protein J3D65DRAFT_642913 [Phyllosticta citribraziliensis]|uniref:Uncharacterized protein n=1 Tax=Phyllosticta citribraziliensis TaxID=989973 RepID=A0ABR1L1X3_9PEZI